MRVALINMPSALAVCPSTAVGCLKAQLVALGHAVTDIYANVYYAAHIGFERYHKIFNEYDLLAGNFLFAAQANNLPIDRPAYYDAILRRKGVERDFLSALVENLEEAVPLSDSFLVSLGNKYDWGSFDTIAFSSTFQQQAATIAFARQLKERFRNIPIVCGGANFHEDMGAAWLEAVDAFDYVCTGEGEKTFAAYLEYLDNQIELEDIPNFAYKVDGGVKTTKTERSTLNNSIVPDYEQFYRTAKQSGITGHYLWQYHRLPLETSRGCWWGAKQHCVFCGLNGADMTYDHRSDNNALLLIEEAANRYNVRHIQFVDNIMPRSYTRTIFSELAKRGVDLTFFYEIKANVSITELRNLALGGVKQLQPGIESLDRHLLDLVKKGSTGLQNLFF